MHPDKILNVLKLNDEDRYTYFISKVTENEEVWGLYNNGWAILSEAEGKVCIPFWPEKEFALLCCKDQWQSYTPQAITLDNFMKKWLQGMKQDNRFATVFYVNDQLTNILVTPDHLLEDLNNKLQIYM